LQIQRQRRIEFDSPAITRVRKHETRGVKKRALEPLDGAKMAGGSPPHATVRRIPHNRMADRAQVDADLVRAASRDRDVEERHAIEVARESHSRDRISRAPGSGRHPLPIVGIPSDWRIDPSSGMDYPPHERDIFFLHLTIRELSRQFLMGAIVLGHHHQARRAAIESMDDAGSQFPTDAAQVLDVMEQGIDECSA